MATVDPTLIPADEAERLAALRRYDLLDTPPDGAFDRITAIAARIFNVPISIVSVVDQDRIWFKSHPGLDVDEVDREPGLCASAILQNEPWVISDARHDPRALANPLVAGDLGVQFYAGVPLKSVDGHNLGTLCILDFKPRELSAHETGTLQDLAAMVNDALELRLASRRLLDEATERERLKDAFFGMLSHELRTPVTTIYAAAQILSDTPGVADDPRARDLFPDILSESDRLLRLIEDLLVLTRVEQGSLESMHEPVLLQRVIPRTVDRESRRWSGRKIEVDIAADLPPVAGDELFIEQVLSNLLSNALKYSPPDAPVEVAAERDGDAIAVRVRDHGIGLSTTDRETVFDLFIRTSEASRYASGAGIGLYVCRRLLQAMDGDIRAESAPGRGSVFAFRLNVATE